MEPPKHFYNSVFRHTSRATAAHRRDLWPSGDLRLAGRIQAAPVPNYAKRISPPEINLLFGSGQNASGLSSVPDHYG